MADFKNVADFLHEHALDNATDPSANGCILGACNRYYYYVYRLVRKEMLESGKIEKQDDFEHGSGGGKLLKGRFKNSIRTKLPEAEAEEFNALCDNTAKLFIELYNFRLQVDYHSPTVTKMEESIFIEYQENNKTISKSTQDIQDAAEQITKNIEMLSKYRKRAGYVEQ